MNLDLFSLHFLKSIFFPTELSYILHLLNFTGEDRNLSIHELKIVVYVTLLI